MGQIKKSNDDQAAPSLHVALRMVHPHDASNRHGSAAFRHPAPNVRGAVRCGGEHWQYGWRESAVRICHAQQVLTTMKVEIDSDTGQFRHRHLLAFILGGPLRKSASFLHSLRRASARHGWPRRPRVQYVGPSASDMACWLSRIERVTTCTGNGVSDSGRNASKIARVRREIGMGREIQMRIIAIG